MSKKDNIKWYYSDLKKSNNNNNLLIIYRYKIPKYIIIFNLSR